MSDPRDQRTGGHPQNDPDDICSMASLLLESNRFHIERIVVGSTNRKQLKDPMYFVNEVFVASYQHDLPFLNAEIGGYQDEMPFVRSDLTKTAEPIRFDASCDYEDLTSFGVVRDLVDYASGNPVYVLCWGPLTEPAIAVKHCLATGNFSALENMTFVAHWTMSFIAQGKPETPYKVANCQDNWDACQFLHEIANEVEEVKYFELGSVGQTGIVNGGAGFQYFDQFNASRLGQIFIKSKFYHGKPDQSDASTFWILPEEFGASLGNYESNGVLDVATEKANRDRFFAHGTHILKDLLLRSNAASKAENPWSESFIADYFTYVYQFLNGRYYVYLPYDAEVGIRDGDGKLLMQMQLSAGNHQLSLTEFNVGKYDVSVRCGGMDQQFILEKTAP